MHATADELAGLPPHVISVNGTCHAGDCLFLDAMPDLWHATIRDIKGFADSL